MKLQIKYNGKEYILRNDYGEVGRWKATQRSSTCIISAYEVEFIINGTEKNRKDPNNFKFQIIEKLISTFLKALCFPDISGKSLKK